MNLCASDPATRIQDNRTRQAGSSSAVPCCPSGWYSAPSAPLLPPATHPSRRQATRKARNAASRLALRSYPVSTLSHLLFSRCAYVRCPISTSRARKPPTPDGKSHHPGGIMRLELDRVLGHDFQQSEISREPL